MIDVVRLVSIRFKILRRLLWNMRCQIQNYWGWLVCAIPVIFAHLMFLYIPIIILFHLKKNWGCCLHLFHFTNCLSFIFCPVWMLFGSRLNVCAYVVWHKACPKCLYCLWHKACASQVYLSVVCRITPQLPESIFMKSIGNHNISWIYFFKLVEWSHVN